MARRNLGELAAGAVVLVVAAGFLAYAVAHTSTGGISGHILTAKFDHIDGLGVGSDVRLAGVKVGTVAATTIDAKTYQAVVRFSVEPSIALPTDSSATISSGSLLGSNYLSLAPGGSETMIPDGGTVTITQGSVSLEQLLGKFIFNVGDLSANVQKSLDQKAAPAAGGLPPLK